MTKENFAKLINAVKTTATIFVIYTKIMVLIS